MKMNQLLEHIKNLKHKGRCYFAFIFGLALVGALPPFFLLPVAVLSFSGFFILLEQCENKKRSFWLGWWFGFGYFLLGVYWVANSLLVDADSFAWLFPFAVTLIPAISALFVGMVAVVTHAVFLNRLQKVILFSCMWALAEIARGYLTQFPWNFVGYMWLSSSESYVAQAASYVGVWGLSALLVLFATVPALLWQNSYKNCWKPILCVWGAVFFLFTWGGQQVLGAKELASELYTEKQVVVRLVQPNISQKDKQSPYKNEEVLSKHLQLNLIKPQGEDPQLIIWPEAAVSFSFENDAKLREVIAESIPQNSVLIAGGMRFAGNSQQVEVWNSLFVVDKNTKVRAKYDKHTLVPFGEYVPFQSYIPFIKKITQGNIGFSQGSGPQTIKIEGYPSFSPLICYEAIFAGNVLDDSHMPDFLLNVTNDAWFGNTMGPYQHLHITRMRAIEEGLPLLRVANTGVSAVIDSYGTVLQSLQLNTANVIDAVLPKASHVGRSFFSKYKAYVPIFLILAVACLFVFRK